MRETRMLFCLVRSASGKSCRAKIQILVGRNLFRSLASLLMAACIGSTASPARAEDEMNVGHNAAGQLQVQVDFEQPLGLPVSVFPGSPGYATGEVGFHSTPLDDPTNDFFQLSPAADLRFSLVARDPEMEVWIPIRRRLPSGRNGEGPPGFVSG
jgi:hypothetical protein